MHISHHASQRMNQRGISGRLVEFARRHGRIEGNKRVLDRNESRRLLEDLNEELRLVKRVLDKGGITVVDNGDTVVTTYNCSKAASHAALRKSRMRHSGEGELMQDFLPDRVRARSRNS